MDTPQPQPANTEANIRKAAEAIAEVLRMKQEFIRYHDFLTTNTHRLVELLCEAETRVYLLEDALTLVETTHWLQMIDWQSKFVSVVLGFTKDPSSKSLRPLIEPYGRDRDRMRVEAEILERQLKHQLATFAQPDDARGDEHSEKRPQVSRIAERSHRESSGGSVRDPPAAVVAQGRRERGRKGGRSPKKPEGTRRRSCVPLAPGPPP